MNKILKKIILIIITLIMTGVIGYVLLVTVYSLPTTQMTNHMLESSEYFEDEGISPRLMGNDNSVLDNHTDALMLLTASHPRTENIWRDAVNNERYYKAGEYPNDTVISIYKEEEKSDVKTTSYARYWHGYLIFLKPLLLFMDYGQIRSLMMCAQLCVFFLSLLEISKKRQELVIPLFITWIFLNPVSTMLSLQYNSVLMITFIAIFLICKFSNEINKVDEFKWGLFFLIVGALTSYFDLLTYPLVSFGIPLIVWISIHMSKEIICNVFRIIRIALYWGIGYAGMWMIKWILGDLITGEKVILNAVDNIAVRVSSNVSDVVFDYWDVLEVQIKSSHQITWKIAIICVVILFICGIIKRRNISWNTVVVFSLILLSPFVWYWVLKNHSYIHSYFTYRELSISICALSTCITIHRGEVYNG